MNRSEVAATPDLVPASVGAWTGCWFPGLSGSGGPINRWAEFVRPKGVSFGKPATRSSTDASRRAVLDAMKNVRRTPPATRLSVSALVSAGMPVYLPVTMDLGTKHHAKFVIDAATRTVENLKETISLNPRLSVYIGG